MKKITEQGFTWLNWEGQDASRIEAGRNPPYSNFSIIMTKWFMVIRDRCIYNSSLQAIIVHAHDTPALTRLQFVYSLRAGYAHSRYGHIQPP